MPAPPGPPPQPWSQHVTKSQRAPALEPIDLPPAIEQGVDMIYIDEELVPRAVQDRAMMHDISFDDWSGAPVDLFMSVNPIYTDLRRGLVKYRQQWSDLPQIPIAAGPTMKDGTTGERVAALRRNSREIVDAERPTRRATSRTPHPVAFNSAISSRSENDR